MSPGVAAGPRSGTVVRSVLIDVLVGATAVGAGTPLRPPTVSGLGLGEVDRGLLPALRRHGRRGADCGLHACAEPLVLDELEARLLPALAEALAGEREVAPVLLDHLVRHCEVEEIGRRVDADAVADVELGDLERR